MFKSSSYRVARAAWLTSFVLTTTALADDVVTSFEFNDSTGLFTLGSSPASVSFAGGNAASAGMISYAPICWARRIMITAKRAPAKTW